MDINFFRALATIFILIACSFSIYDIYRYYFLDNKEEMVSSILSACFNSFIIFIIWYENI